MTMAVTSGPGPASAEAWAAALEEIAGGDAADFRADVPEGTVLREQRTEGGDLIRERKTSSMMRAGGAALPSRVPLWNLQTKTMKMVPPTIAQKRRMQGTKQFPPSAFSLRDPHFEQREPIEETCRICDLKRAQVGNPPRRFYDLTQYEAHMQILHPREWETEMRRSQQQERLDDRQSMRDLISEIVKALRPDVLQGADTTQVEEQIAEAVEAQMAEPELPWWENYTKRQIRGMLEEKGIVLKDFQFQTTNKEKLARMLMGEGG